MSAKLSAIYAVLCSLLLCAFLSSCCKRYSLGERPEFVSIVSILANPEKYDGKKILVSGVLSVKDENRALYLGVDDYDHLIVKNSIWLDGIRDSDSALDSLTRHYVLVEGLFNAGKKGHLSLFSGEISAISGIYPWGNSNAKFQFQKMEMHPLLMTDTNVVNVIDSVFSDGK